MATKKEFIWIELLCRRHGAERAIRSVVPTVTADVLAVAMTGDFVAAWMPSVFVPLVGIVGPAVAMTLLFNVIEARD